MKHCYQKTLKKTLRCDGIGLHSGEEVAMVMHPAAADSGITFVRTDVVGGPHIAARWDNVTDTHLHTTIGDDRGNTVGTIEHLMAALVGCRVDNALVEVDAAELPAMDGSAEPFRALIEEAGVTKQSAPRKAIRIEKEVTVSDGDSLARFRPGPGTLVHCEINFSAGAISRQGYRFHMGEDHFGSELSPARTFAALHEVEHLRQRGLARGGSLDNAIVVDGHKVLNEEGLRFSNEFARHKALDALGDLYLAGHPFLGEFYGYRCGHRLNNRALCALLADNTAWSLCDMPAADVPVPQTDIPLFPAGKELPLAATA